MPEHKRPDPDLLLKQINQKSMPKSNDSKGKLKIFLGYCAGVGKTYRMLQEARLKQSNFDIVIGLIETHGRKDTEALVESLEIIPKTKLEYSGILLEEMNLDAIIDRKPNIVLVDELAHTNIPGSRHAKRYQDVEELLNEGINVYTTLNIQHLESIIDVVLQISNVKIDETVPDRILELADEIELVDLPPDKLLDRLREGRIYIPQKAQKAMQNFFQKGNLLALREIALRYTAKQVDEEMVNYMQKKSISGPWPAGSRLLVAISSSPASESLIRHTYRMAKDLNSIWYAVHVESPQQLKIDEAYFNQLQKNIKLAEELEGKVIYLKGDNIADEMIRFAKEKNVTLIIAGLSHRSRLEEFIKGSVLNDLVKKCAPINVLIVSRENKSQSLIPSLDPEKKDIKLYATSFSLVTITVFISWLLRDIINPTNFGMILMLPSIASSILWGTRIGIFASILALASFNFFFVPPYYTFAISDLNYIPSFIVFIGVNIFVSILGNIIRWQIHTTKMKERFISSLYSFNKEIMASNSLEELIIKAKNNIDEAFNSDVVIFVEDNVSKNLDINVINNNLQDDNETGRAFWVYRNSKPAGKYTNTLNKSEWYYIPLQTEERTIGVLGIRSKNPTAVLYSEQLRLIDSFGSVISMSVRKYTNL